MWAFLLSRQAKYFYSQLFPLKLGPNWNRNSANSQIISHKARLRRRLSQTETSSLSRLLVSEEKIKKSASGRAASGAAGVWPVWEAKEAEKERVWGENGQRGGQMGPVWGQRAECVCFGGDERAEEASRRVSKEIEREREFMMMIVSLSLLLISLLRAHLLAWDLAACRVVFAGLLRASSERRAASSEPQWLTSQRDARPTETPNRPHWGHTQTHRHTNTQKRQGRPLVAS